MKRSFTLLVRPGLTGKHKMYKDTLKKERKRDNSSFDSTIKYKELDG